MGISAKKFGPVAWKCLEAIAVLCDLYISNEKNALKRTLMRALFARAMFSIGFVLPCVYCRFSFRTFTNPTRALNDSVDILKSIHLEDGCKKFVYHLHVAVNHKLEKQEIEAGGSAQFCVTHEKWQNYNISYEEALKTRFGQRSVGDVWVYLTTLIAFIICDFDEVETRVHTGDLFASVYDMFTLFTEKNPPRLLLSKLATIGPEFYKKRNWRTNTNRQTLAWTAHEGILQSGGWGDRVIIKSDMSKMCLVQSACPISVDPSKK